MLTAAALGTVLATAEPSVAGTESLAGTNTEHSTVSPPYDIAVTSTLGPNGTGAIHSDVTTNIPVSAGNLALRWNLDRWNGTSWVHCKQSSPTNAYTYSPATSTTLALDDSAYNADQTACGDGWYNLVVDGAAFVNGNFHGVIMVKAGQELLKSANSPPIKFFAPTATPPAIPGPAPVAP